MEQHLWSGRPLGFSERAPEGRLPALTKASWEPDVCSKLTKSNEGRSLPFIEMRCADSGCQVLLDCCRANQGCINLSFMSFLLQNKCSS